ncbi:PQQ-like beta-propeller repeat protein [Pseudophaeobacter flagellatus]|uniref:PQQ-like beta-propeller repeat protein n=1 Tax=Pseudophaeobacter flagellatus TaxID=2899119 RepID=UPI001E2E836D|nr:PQQ-like beta-propeller repeat protein [Pseudophaeobacter flagellatus]MCD9147617.1 PQQ-like beta-propeller repeat protein [Pseudophaeobacter flagellatus]
MTAANSFSLVRVLLCSSALALGLTACTEPEVILPGKREAIRPELEADVVNQSVAISLPRQVANTTWAQGHGNSEYRTTNPALGAALQLAWSAPIGAGDSRKQRITTRPVVAAGRIYTLDSAARVSAVSPAGQVLWASDLLPARDSEGQATGGGMAYADGVLYISSGYGVLTALDAASGKQIWRQELDATGSGEPRVSDGLVYLVAGDDTGWAVHAKDGRIAWQVEGAPSPSNVLGAPAPVLTKDLVIFAFGSGDLVATFRRGGLRRWSASVAGQRTGSTLARISDVTGSPVLVGQRAYVGNHSGRTVAFDTASGDRIWTAQQGAIGPVWPVGNSLFQISDRNQLLRLNADSGETLWAVDLPGYLKDKPGKRSEIVAHYGPLLAGGQIVVASNDGLLRFFDPRDGSQIRSVEVPGGATAAPVVAGNTLYVVTSKGNLLAYR